MKNSLTLMLATLSLSGLLASCNTQNVESASTISTGFSMTGSGQDTVAKSDVEKLFSFFVPNAYALTPPPLMDANGESVTLDEAWIVVKKIEFHTKEEDAGPRQNQGAQPRRDSQEDEDKSFGSDHPKLRGPHFVNLLADEPTTVEGATLPASGVKRLKMELHKSITIPEGAPEGLRGNSIYLSGMSNGIAFSFASSETSEFRIKGPHSVKPEASKQMMAIIKIAGLFKRIDLSVISEPTHISKDSRIPAVNPCPLIDPQAQDLYSCFRKGLESHARFGKDNGDRELDDRDQCVHGEEIPEQNPAPVDNSAE